MEYLSVLYWQREFFRLDRIGQSFAWREWASDNLVNARFAWVTLSTVRNG